MKKYYFFLLLLISLGLNSQGLPINFEGDITTSNFSDFDGGIATVVDNPNKNGINTSNSVGQIIRDGGKPWAGSKVALENNLDFSTLTKITMKVYTTAPIGTTVKLKLEGSGAPSEQDAFTTVTNTWETLEWVYLGVPNNLNELVFMFDFGNIGDGSVNSTFYFDDINQIQGPVAPVPTALPIDFESGIVATDFINYSGATANVISNPHIDSTNPSAMVGQIIRDGGDFWAGSKIFLNGNLDLSTNWHIQMKVYTTAPVGTRIKLELENTSGRTNLDYVTTVSGAWEIATWNFDGKANDYDKIQFLFDFGNVGDGTQNSTFLFDDIQQIQGPELAEPQSTDMPIDFEASLVTTDFINEDGGIATIIANPFKTNDNPSETIAKFVRSGGAPWAKSKIILNNNIDFTTKNSISMKVYTEAPVGAVLKLKVESFEAGAFADERDAVTTVSGAWETYTWTFPSDVPPLYRVLSLMLGYTTPNDASKNATFYIDDIQQTTSTLNAGNYFFEKENISIYPNPAKNTLYVNSKNLDVKSILIFDILGNKILDYEPNQLKASINISSLAKGIYFAKIITDSGYGSKKFIKQ